MSERWKDVVGYDGIYQVSDMGRVRSCARQGSKGGIINPSPDQRGYLKVSLYNRSRKAFWVHRLVLAAFVGPCPDGKEGCHGDGDPSNNTLGNLRWDTKAANYADAISHGTAAIGERNGQTKVSKRTLALMRSMRASGATQSRIASEFSLSQQHVSALLSGVGR